MLYRQEISREFILLREPSWYIVCELVLTNLGISVYRQTASFLLQSDARFRREGEESSDSAFWSSGHGDGRLTTRISERQCSQN